MVQVNFGILLKNILLDKAKEFLFFPLWWYGKGLLMAIQLLWRKVLEMEARLALRVWIANIFTPMFGQRDFSGVMISVFMRIVQIIGRFFILIIWTFLMAGLVVLWIILPIFAFLGIIINIVA